jgi:hypothetical protein
MICACCTAFFQNHLNQQELFATTNRDQIREVLYLPNGTGLEVISFGFRNGLSQILWFNTINYFGKHYAQDRDYRWLNHMCDLVTELNPRAVHAYRFCSLMLAWEANYPKQAVDLLNKAISHHPDNWELLYLRGVTRLLFLNDGLHAKEDLVRAARLPNAHPLVARLAARKISSTEDPATALHFLEEIIAETKDPSTIRALKRRAKEIRQKLLTMKD